LIKHQKNKTFAMIDAGMNDLLRPALYHAKHRICELKVRSGSAESYHVVGPVCETSDQFCSHHLMIKPGDYLSILDVGAYGMSMASNYNTRLKPAEVLVTDNTWHVIRQRGSYHDLCQLEKI
ncbi:MAG: diaminopimelate decarboxylase, partial [Endozoicomonadaceae bacterium]|nr:diaminopimelate decarboxylase [Endozoicomonadaceae bacterium]